MRFFQAFLEGLNPLDCQQDSVHKGRLRHFGQPPLNLRTSPSSTPALASSCFRKASRSSFFLPCCFRKPSFAASAFPALAFAVAFAFAAALAFAVALGFATAVKALAFALAFALGLAFLCSASEASLSFTVSNFLVKAQREASAGLPLNSLDESWLEEVGALSRLRSFAEVVGTMAQPSLVAVFDSGRLGVPSCGEAGGRAVCSGCLRLRQRPCLEALRFSQLPLQPSRVGRKLLQWKAPMKQPFQQAHDRRNFPAA